jgi:hypothetical protein
MERQDEDDGCMDDKHDGYCTFFCWVSGVEANIYYDNWGTREQKAAEIEHRRSIITEHPYRVSHREYAP